MLVLLVAAAAFVFWRVQVALDHRLNEDLAAQTRDLHDAARRLPPRAALASLRDQSREAQLLRADGTILASGSAIAAGSALLTPAEAREAAQGRLETTRGNLFSPRGPNHLRILAVPVRGSGPAEIAVSAVRLDQRDEALRELLLQLAVANLVALAIASLVGYRFAHVALDPVERYRQRAERIARGATGVRLEVPAGPPDEITRLGTTLNEMLDALERSAERQQQFIDDASHELRSPLSTLSAEIDVALRKERTAPEYEATLERLAEDVTAIRDLAEDLLSLGALGSSTPGAASISAEELLANAARRARAQLPAESGRRVEIDAASVDVYGDRRLLERALGNVADNAVRHGTGTITFSAEAIDGAAALFVHDDGLMPHAFLAHAAERFRRHDGSRSGKGAGLGLSLVDAIAVAHGGQLRVCSGAAHHRQRAADPQLDELPCRHPEAGTTITLLLPRPAS
jgi:signal transduction histidine kinase